MPFVMSRKRSRRTGTANRQPRNHRIELHAKKQDTKDHSKTAKTTLPLLRVSTIQLLRISLQLCVERARIQPRKAHAIDNESRFRFRSELRSEAGSNRDSIHRLSEAIYNLCS
jgi:hypothetical protein